MKNLKLFAVLFLMTGLFVACVDNEESDSVKELREAQAELLRSMAASEIMEATADSAYVMAQAKLEEAEAKLTEAQVEAQKLFIEAQTAENELYIAEIQYDIEALEIENEARLEALELETQALINEAQEELESSINSLEETIAIYEVTNPALDEYMAEYKSAINEVKSLQSEIIFKKLEIITTANQYSASEQASLSDAAMAAWEADKSDLSYELEILESDLEAYQAKADKYSALLTAELEDLN